ncbi:T9SS type A sorting domain-containing protein, partial [Candidatus Poribacteria bacterium]|nr:T9SS type A sorting domain-containing protein [Candidatus Poribacteria bacterium]
YLCTVPRTLLAPHVADGFVYGWSLEYAVSVSGIDGVTLAGGVWGPERVSDTEIAVELEFDGTDFDTDATLTFTVSALVSNHSSDLTAQIPVTAIQQSNATVSLSPTPVISPNIGEQLTFSINIEDGKDVAGYQATVLYDNSALRLMEATKGNYLPADAFFLPDWDHYRYAADETYGYTYVEARLTANTLAEAANGDGTLTTLTFEVLDFKPSTVPLSEIYLVDADGKRWEATTENGEVTIPPEPAEALFGDINRDGVVNIQDLVIVGTRLGQRGKNSADVNEDGLVNVVDIVLVASAFDAAAAAPALYPQALQLITAAEVKDWFSQAQQLTRTDPAYLRGMTVLEELLKALTPKKSALLPNYPNPFNPETWIPYHLSNSADVQVSIYDIKGMLVRRLDFGHQIAGYYTDRTKAAYWDGKNEFGESIASGLYFFTLTAGDFTATRKMLIRK